MYKVQRHDSWGSFCAHLQKENNCSGNKWQRSWDSWFSQIHTELLTFAALRNTSPPGFSCSFWHLNRFTNWNPLNVQTIPLLQFTFLLPSSTCTNLKPSMHPLILHPSVWSFPLNIYHWNSILDCPPLPQIPLLPHHHFLMKRHAGMQGMLL